MSGECDNDMPPWCESRCARVGLSSRVLSSKHTDVTQLQRLPCALPREQAPTWAASASRPFKEFLAPPVCPRGHALTWKPPVCRFGHALAAPATVAAPPPLSLLRASHFLHGALASGARGAEAPRHAAHLGPATSAHVHRPSRKPVHARSIFDCVLSFVKHT